MKKYFLTLCANIPCIGSYYFKIVAILLFFTATVKVMSLFGDYTQYLHRSDPLFAELPTLYIFIFASFLEIFVATLLFLIHSVKIKSLLVLWLSLIFVVYRLGLWYYYPTRVSCKCMGSFSKWIHLTEQSINTITFGILVFMIIGSFLLFFISMISNTEKHN